MNRKIILFGVFLSVFILILVPSIRCVNAIIQNENNYNVNNNTGADLTVVDFRLTNSSYDIGGLCSDVDFIIKNIGDDTYIGKLFYSVEVKPIFTPPMSLAGGWISKSNNFSIESGEEFTYNGYQDAGFGTFYFPFLYLVKVKIEPYGKEIDKDNNYLFKYIFITGFFIISK